MTTTPADPPLTAIRSDGQECLRLRAINVELVRSHNGMLQACAREQARAEAATDERDAIASKLEETLAKYHELILEVGTVYQGESRHATALRFIREREPLNRTGEAGQAASDGHRLEAAGKGGA